MPTFNVLKQIPTATTSSETPPIITEYVRPPIIDELGELGVGYTTNPRYSDGIYEAFKPTNP
jgi:hypothetical protein